MATSNSDMLEHLLRTADSAQQAQSEGADYIENKDDYKADVLRRKMALVKSLHSECQVCQEWDGND